MCVCVVSRVVVVFLYFYLSVVHIYGYVKR